MCPGAALKKGFFHPGGISAELPPGGAGPEEIPSVLQNRRRKGRPLDGCATQSVAGRVSDSAGIRVQVSSGSKVSMAAAIFSVFGPRSFW